MSKLGGIRPDKKWRMRRLKVGAGSKESFVRDREKKILKKGGHGKKWKKEGREVGGEVRGTCGSTPFDEDLIKWWRQIVNRKETGEKEL